MVPTPGDLEWAGSAPNGPAQWQGPVQNEVSYTGPNGRRGGEQSQCLLR
jgi:hypothetical protein